MAESDCGIDFEITVVDIDFLQIACLPPDGELDDEEVLGDYWLA